MDGSIKGSYITPNFQKVHDLRLVCILVFSRIRRFRFAHKVAEKHSLCFGDVYIHTQEYIHSCQNSVSVFQFPFRCGEKILCRIFYLNVYLKLCTNMPTFEKDNVENVNEIFSEEIGITRVPWGREFRKDEQG